MMTVSNLSEIELIGQGLSSFDLVMVGGGDGTVSFIASYLLNSNIPILIIPVGSGNDFASPLKMSTSANSILLAIENQLMFKSNTIKINGNSTALTICCFAFEAKVNRIANKLPRSLGRIKYTLAAFIALIGKTYVELDIRSKNFNETGKYCLAILANGPFFGGGMQVSKKAHLQAEDLQLILVNKVNRFKLVYLFLLLLLGKHFDHKDFREFPVTAVEIKGKTGILRAQSDGESLAVGDIYAELFPKSLTVLRV
jgi:diacylglycerol kinase (ATP)